MFLTNIKITMQKDIIIQENINFYKYNSTDAYLLSLSLSV